MSSCSVLDEGESRCTRVEQLNGQVSAAQMESIASMWPLSLLFSTGFLPLAGLLVDTEQRPHKCCVPLLEPTKGAHCFLSPRTVAVHCPMAGVTFMAVYLL